MSRIRTVRAHATLHATNRGSGFTSLGLRDQLGSLDPFINLDDFHMSQPTFPPHPHAGFSAVTYMFEDSPGAFINRDSLGDRSRIGPGTLHWAQAAQGMLHEEVPEHPGTDCHGVQIFVNLAAEHKHTEPRVFHLEAEQVPELFQGPGVRVRVLCGESYGTRSPLALLTPITLLDVHLAPGARFEQPVPAGHAAFAMVIHGRGVVGPDSAAVALEQGMAAAFAEDGEVIALQAALQEGTQGFHALVGMGRPLREPVIAHGPFIMNTRAQIADAIRRYETGRMGRLELA